LDLKDWYMVAEKTLWYLLKRYHILFNPIGPEMDYHGSDPLHGHIADIESHMMRERRNLAESFQEGLAGKVPQQDPAPAVEPEPSPT
jgi:hypothetical protein